MIRFCVADVDGTLVRNGHAPDLATARNQAKGAERAFKLDDFGFIDMKKLKVNFNTMLINLQDGVMGDVQGAGAPVTELVEDSEDAEA